MRRSSSMKAGASPQRPRARTMTSQSHFGFQEILRSALNSSGASPQQPPHSPVRGGSSGNIGNRQSVSSSSPHNAHAGSSSRPKSPVTPIQRGIRLKSNSDTSPKLRSSNGNPLFPMDDQRSYNSQTMRANSSKSPDMEWMHTRNLSGSFGFNGNGTPTSKYDQTPDQAASHGGANIDILQSFVSNTLDGFLKPIVEGYLLNTMTKITGEPASNITPSSIIVPDAVKIANIMSKELHIQVPPQIILESDTNEVAAHQICILILARKQTKSIT